MIYRLLLSVSIVFLNACAIGNTTQYNGGLAFKPELPTTTSSISVAVQDNRPEVLSGSHSPNYVGIQRSLAGVPWTIKTKSREPLAVDLADSIVTTLSNNKISAKVLPVALGASEDDIAKEFKSLNTNPNDMLFSFVLDKWDNERWFSDIFRFCIKLKVKSYNNSTLGESSECGEQKLESSNVGFENLGHGVGTVIGKLFNADGVKTALNNTDRITLAATTSTNTPKTTTSAKHSCSASDVLALRDAGLTDQMIRSRCM